MSKTIVNDLLENGLPSWVLSWKTIIPGSIIISILFLFLLSTFNNLVYYLSGRSHYAPDCFSIGTLSAEYKGQRSLAETDRFVERIRWRRKDTISSLRKTAKNCSPLSCRNRQYRVRFQHAIWAYMGRRAGAMHKMYVRYSGPGLEYAKHLYETKDDVWAINTIRAAYSAGLYEAPRRGKYESAIRMMLFKPIEELKLCRGNG